MSIDKSEYVAKEKLRVQIETQRERLTGFVHVLYRHRASDLLNDDSRFIPVTDVKVTTLDGGKENSMSFLAINKDHIVTLTELPSEGGE